MHGDFLAKEVDDKLLGGVSLRISPFEGKQAVSPAKRSTAFIPSPVNNSLFTSYCGTPAKTSSRVASSNFARFSFVALPKSMLLASTAAS